MSEEEGMGMIMPDFSEAASGEFAPLPDGIYSARIVDCQQKVAQKNGIPYTNVKLETFNAEDPKLNGRYLYYVGMHAGPGTARLQKLLQAVGREPGPYTHADLIGREVQVQTAIRKRPDGSDDPYPNIKSIKALTH